MKSALLVGVALVALSLGAAPAIADVTVCDRALRVTEMDLGYNGGLELGMERVYRSDSTRIGLFGRGWGSRYETRLIKEADGRMAVLENGCDAALSFEPASNRPGVWVGKGCGDQQIKQTADGFERRQGIAKTERFSADGRLMRVEDANGNWIALNYDGERLIAVQDNRGRVLTLVYGSDGRIERVQGDGGREARYRFDAEGRVIGVTDADGTEHRYAYDDAGLLIGDAIPGGKTMTASYGDGRLSSLDHNGTIRRFGGGEGEGWRETSETVVDSDGNPRFSSRRIALYRPDGQGRSLRWREFSDNDGRRMDIEYNTQGLVAIKRDGAGRSGGFRYDAMGRLTHKETPEGTVDVTYDPKVGKVSRVERRVGKSRSWSRFAYDGRGNLIALTSSDGRDISLAYDPMGHIATVAEQGRHFTFSYNRDAKPVTISLRGVGTMNVEYDAKGEVANVKSDGGVTLALRVTAMFQSLLSVTKSADVKADL